MAYTAWSVVYGEQPSAAKWNILGANDASFNDGTGIAVDTIDPTKWTNPYCFRAYRSGSLQSIPASTETKIEFNAESFDPNSNFDSTTNYDYTVPVTGYYQINAGLRMDNMSDGEVVDIRISVNGSNYTQYRDYVSGSGTSDHSRNINDVVYAVAGQKIIINTYQNNASARNLLNDSTYTYFSGHLVHAT